MRRLRTLSGICAFSAFVIVSSAVAALSPDVRCANAQLKGTAKKVGSALACQAKAAKLGIAADPVCLQRAGDKMASTFQKAEAKGGCASTGDFSVIEGIADELIDDAVSALAHGGDEESRRCAAAKRKSVGKKAKSALTCTAKGLKKSEAAAPECLSKTSGRLASGFAKAEARGACATAGDAGAVCTQVDDAHEEVVERIVALCGDAIVGPGEQCDGDADAACPGQCDAQCSCTTVCGNGLLEGSEECDGADAAACPGLCLSSCVCPGTCGNGSVEGEEECDDGGNVGGDGCRDDCVLENTSALCAGVAASAATSFAIELVGTFTAPVHAASPPLDPLRLFVVEQAGVIRVLRGGSKLATPFLDIAAAVSSGGERGLLSMAFDPDYESNGRFFVNYTRDPDGATVVSRFNVSANPDVADPSSEKILLVIPQPYGNHNGGQVAFGPDGRLYVGMGDGGAGGDPLDNGQSDAALLGKMLRLDIDVDVPPYHAVPPDNPNAAAGLPLGLIWAKGLRNPWRFSFDRANGDLYIADVGQNAVEEIDHQPAVSTGGENYGWDDMEGSSCFEPVTGCLTAGRVLPIVEYHHPEGCSVTGGHVYRGCSLPALAGSYFYSDYCTQFIRTFEVSGGAATNPIDRSTALGTSGNVASFAEDARGEQYIVNHGGQVYKIVAAP